MIELNGYIKLHRKLVQWGWYTDYVVKDTFLHLLIMSSFRETDWMGRTIRPGQLVTSYKRLASDLGFSVRQIRTAIDKLESTGELARETTNKYTVITVVNWDKYQVLDAEATSTATNERQTENAVFCKQIMNKIKNLQKTTSKTTSKEELESIINSGFSELEEYLETSGAALKRQTSDKQTTNERQHRKNVKNVKNVKNNNKGGVAAEFSLDGFASFLGEGDEGGETE